MNPREPVMRRCGREDSLGVAEAVVDLFKPAQEARHGAGTDGDMISDRNVAVAQFPGDHLNFLFGRRVQGPQEIGAQVFAETAVNVADAAVTARPSRPPSSIQCWTAMCALASIRQTSIGTDAL